MKPIAICYTSNTGSTAKYAEMMGKKTGLPVYDLREAKRALEKNAPIIYFGWLFANSVKNYKKAAAYYNITAVCGVGLCDTGMFVEKVRTRTAIPQNTPLFTLQGNMDKSKLHGINKVLINMLTKGLSAQVDRTPQDERMLHLITTTTDYVSEDNLFQIADWYNNLV